MLAVNTSVLAGTEINPGSLTDLCQMVPFMNPVRLIIVEGLLDVFEPEFKQRRNGQSSHKRGAKKIDEWGMFTDTISSIPETTVLVFIDEKATRNVPRPITAENRVRRSRILYRSAIRPSTGEQTV